EYDLDTRKQVRTYPVEGARLLALPPARGRLATLDKTGRIHVWDTDNGTLVTVLTRDRLPEELRDLDAGLGTTAMTFSGDGVSLFTGHADGSLIQWSVETGNLLNSLLAARGSSAVRALRESADRQSLLVGQDSGELRRCEVGRLDRELSYDTDGPRVLEVAGSPDGDFMLACSTDGRVSMFEFDPPTLSTRGRMPPGPELVAAALFRSYAHLCAVDARGVISVVDLNDQKRVMRLRGLGEKVAGLAVSSNGRLAVSYGRVVFVWALDPTGRGKARETVTALARSPDGTRIWAGRPDHSIELWDRGQRRTLARWRAHQATITALATDGKRVYSAALDGRLAVWPAEGEEAVRSIRGPAAPTALAIGEPGSVCTGSIDGSVEVWSTTRKRRVALLQHAGELPVVAIVVRGKELHAWDTAGKYRAWDLQTRNRIAAGALDPPPPVASRKELPPIESELVDWIRQSAKRRLIQSENLLGLMVEGAAVVAVPPGRYQPRQPRIYPWSR
ncbi:MAG: WD40 repeat domain-containing protein, partial [Planctomycetota bacterium]